MQDLLYFCRLLRTSLYAYKINPHTPTHNSTRSLHRETTIYANSLGRHVRNRHHYIADILAQRKAEEAALKKQQMDEMWAAAGY